MAIRRKTKTKLSKNKKPRATRKIKRRKPGSRRVLGQEKKEVLGQCEVVIEKMKFSPLETAKVSNVASEQLPFAYGQDKLVLQVRDPWWVHAYWEIGSETLHKLKNELGEDFYKAKRVLRVYDVSYIIFDGRNAHRFFDIEINEHSDNWYIDTAAPGRSWCVDLGLKLAKGRFITIVRSNTVITPIDGPSWITDEEWMVPEDMFARLYGMGFGLGRSSPVGRAWQERVKKVLFSGVLASPGISSLASPVKKVRS